MRSAVLVSVLAFLAEKAVGQSGAWGQCGGDGYTGPTTCVPGYYCQYSNPWYSQCLPGAGSSSSSSTTTARVTTTTARLTTTTSRASTTASRSSTTTRNTKTTKTTSTSRSMTTSSTATRSSAVTTSATVSGACPSWSPVTAAAAFAALAPGWNLGNTLDAIPNEGSWNNPPVTLATIQDVKAKGFNSIRIPVTWTDHFDTDAPDYTVNKTFLDRVEVVVDQALATGFWVMVNVHHDSWGWMDYSNNSTTTAVVEAKFGKLWDQIAARFKCKSSKLIFEAVNEPTGSTAADATELNNLNNIFMTSVNNAGGNNYRRVLSLSGLNMDIAKTNAWFQRGTLYPNQPWGLQVHYYSPYDFIFDAWGRTIWGNDADKAALTQDLESLRSNFTNVPIVIGEWDATPQYTEAAARWKYFDYFLRECKRLGMSTIIWDNGLDFYLRATNTWTDPAAADILFKTTAGVQNALADSTTDQSATSQNSSAYIFHKVGDPVVAQTAQYTLNNNTLSSIKTSSGATLPASSYSFAADGTLTLSQAYLSTLYTATAAPGIKETLTVVFTPGADLTLTIVQYDTPTAAQTTFSLSTMSTDTTIPITYNGLPQVAAVKALKADGTYLADDWTVWLGPLQQARWTEGNWFFSSAGLILYPTGITTLQAAGQAVNLTVELFPRSVGQNSITFTFTQ